jgi:4-hydroxybenzoate polyprenyltransferase
MAPGRAPAWLELLRCDKPSGRLILLIPAGWALWLGPAVPPPAMTTRCTGAGAPALIGSGS